MFQSMAGLAAFIAIAWGLSENRRQVPWKAVGLGLALQIGLGLLLLKVPWFKSVFLTLNRAVLFLEDSTRAGTAFVFGYLGGGPLPFG